MAPSAEVIVVRAEPTPDAGLFDCSFAVGASSADRIDLVLAVPEAAMPLLYPGSRIPAEVASGTLTIDWAAALGGM